MAYPVTLNGRTYTLADFEGTNYVDGLPDAFEDFVTHAGNTYQTTSTTSITLGTGTLVFTVADSGKPYSSGTPLRISNQADATDYIDALVTSYTGTTLTVNAVGYSGTGTIAAWNINIGGGPITVAGTLPISQGGTGATTAAAAATALGLGTGDTPTFAGLNVTGTANFGDVNITNVGDISLDSISSDAGTSVTVNLGSDAGDDFIVGSNYLVVEGDTGNVGIGGSPTQKLEVNGTDARIYLTGSNTDIDMDNTANGQLHLDGNTYGFGIALNTDGAQLYTNSASRDLIFGVNETEVMRVNSTGAIITNDGNTTQLTLVSTDPDADEGPRLDLQRDSASPADNDAVGTIRWLVRNSAGGNDVFAEIQTLAQDITAGTQDSNMQLLVRRDGSLTEGLSLSATDTVFNESGNDVDFRVESSLDSSALFVSGGLSKVGINRSPSYELDIEPADTGSCELRVSAGTDSGADAVLRLETQATAGTRDSAIYFGDTASSTVGRIVYRHDTDFMEFWTNATRQMVLTNLGRVGINNTSPIGPLEVDDVDISGSAGEEGFAVVSSSVLYHSTDSTGSMYFNDSSSSAGTHNYILWRYQGATIGDIDTLDNSVIRYNTFTGAHWGQFSDHSQPDIKVGTVMSTIDEMCNWTQFEYTDAEGQTQKTDMAGTYEIGTTHTIYIDEDGAQAEGTAIGHDTSKRIAKVKVSDTAGDRSVYGVFAGHYKDGDSSIESLGLGAIRIGSGVTVTNGDLLESAGDGTARPQTGDTADLFKSSTIAKVTSTVVIETYDDGSYTVPCTLHCG